MILFILYPWDAGTPSMSPCAWLMSCLWDFDVCHSTTCSRDFWLNKGKLIKTSWGWTSYVTCMTTKYKLETSS